VVRTKDAWPGSAKYTFCLRETEPPADDELGDFGHKEVLHQQLTHLSAQGQHAVVVEADYADFLAPQKVHPWSASYCAEVLAELVVARPRLRLGFCGNRKLAEEWTRNFFRAVWTAAPDDPGAEHVQPIQRPKRRERGAVARTGRPT
jgi:hypothetical protein